VNSEDKGSRKKAIRLKCLDCCCGSAYEVRLCPQRTCPLWRFRLGAECREKATDFTGDFPARSVDEPPPMEGEIPD